MKLKKISVAVILSAALMAAAPAAFAEDMQTVSITQELGASAAKTWDGKATLKAGQKYVLKKSVTISSKVTIPKGTTLTVNKGVKLSVSSKGSLTVKGTLSIKSGATLSVSGTLKAVSGSKITDAGKVKFNKTSKITLGGKLTISKGGTLSGTPKTIKLGDNGTVTVKGKNSCKKLKTLLEKKAAVEADKETIEGLLNTYIKQAVTGDLYGAMKAVTPASYIEKLEKEISEEQGMTAEEYINTLYSALIQLAGVDSDELAKAAEKGKVSVSSITDCFSSLTDEQKEFVSGCGDITKAYTLELTYTHDGESESLDSYLTSAGAEKGTVTAIYAGESWYFAQ